MPCCEGLQVLVQGVGRPWRALGRVWVEFQEGFGGPRF